MRKSNDTVRSLPHGTVTVIDARVHRQSVRSARSAFVVTTLVTFGVAAVGLSPWLHPVLAMLAGLLGGQLLGAVAYALVRVWPVARLIWWWLPELAVTCLVVWAWVQLNRLPEPAVAIIMALLLGGLLFGPVRRRLTAWVWCLVVRHRLRTCFAQFIIANRAGSLPLILWSRPTPVGERVWIYLRPGLSPADLDARLDKIAVACHASAVLVERASSRSAGYVRIDIKRREVLGVLVDSPLSGADSAAVELPGEIGWARPVPVLPPYAAMDLPDLTPPPAADPAPVPVRPRSRSSAPQTPAASPTPAPAVASESGEDLSDWI